MNEISEKNPRNISGVTPLHFAAKNCHLEVCRWISKNITEKNPRANDGHTPYDMINMEIQQIFR